MSTDRKISRILNANIYTPKGNKAVCGSDMATLYHIPEGVIDVKDGRISYVGPLSQAPVRTVEESELLDARGRVVLPGFVDSHTHFIFGGYRPEEFSWRMRGDSYMSIMERGGELSTPCGLPVTLPVRNFWRRGLSS